METSLATGAIDARTAAPETERFYRLLAQHSPHWWWRVATAKDSPVLSVSRAELYRYPFFQPNHADSWQVIVVDIDPQKNTSETKADTLARITAPDIPRPHWIIETNKGHQAGWLIEDVSTRDGASQKAQAYALATAMRLRRAVKGDTAVHPLTAGRVRNPLYEGLGNRLQAVPMAPYTLRELHWTLYSAGLWPKQLAGGGQGKSREYAGVNDEVNSRAWLTVRRELESGKRQLWTEAQVLDLVTIINMEAASNQGTVPQSSDELRRIAKSITTHQRWHGSRRARSTAASSVEQAERGAKGGSANTAAQRRQRQERAAQGTIARSAKKVLRDEEIRIMRWVDLKTNTEIAAQLGVSTETVRVALKGVFEDPRFQEPQGRTPKSTTPQQPASARSAGAPRTPTGPAPKPPGKPLKGTSEPELPKLGENLPDIPGNSVTCGQSTLKTWYTKGGP